MEILNVEYPMDQECIFAAYVLQNQPQHAVFNCPTTTAKFSERAKREGLAAEKYNVEQFH